MFSWVTGHVLRPQTLSSLSWVFVRSLARLGSLLHFLLTLKLSPHWPRLKWSVSVTQITQESVGVMAGSTVLAVTSNCATRTLPRLLPLWAANTYLYFYPCGDPHWHNASFGPWHWPLGNNCFVPRDKLDDWYHTTLLNLVINSTSWSSVGGYGLDCFFGSP